MSSFVLTGLLFILGAFGMRSATRGSRGGTWGSLLVGVFGGGMAAAGVFIADPGLGFPPVYRLTHTRSAGTVLFT